MSSFSSDLRHALRGLLRNPGFTLVALLMLALGLGSTMAIFSLVDATLIRPLPFAHGGRVVVISNSFRKIGLLNASTSYLDIQDFRSLLKSVDSVAAFTAMSFNLASGGEADRVLGAEVTANFFDTLGVSASLGRTFAAGEDEDGRDGVAVLSHRLWVRRFGGSPTAVGALIRMNGRTYVVAGVLPRDSAYPSQAEIWTPHVFPARMKEPGARGNQYMQTVARLRKGVSLEQARAELAVLAEQRTRQYSNFYPPTIGYGLQAISLLEDIVGDTRQALLVLLAAVGSVLLIVSANLANLLLARATGRRKEIAIRSSLGAGRGRIVRQLLTESTLLSLTGGVLGLLLAGWLQDLLIRFGAFDSARVATAHLDTNLFLFGLGLSLATGLLFGLAPAFQLSRSGMNATLKEAGRGTDGSAPARNLRRALVAIELAAAVALLASAGLLIRSFGNVLAVDPGFRPEGVASTTLALPPLKYKTSVEWAAFFDRVLPELRRIPGVKSAAAISQVPLAQGSASASFEIAGRPTAAGESGPHANMRLVSPAYFDTMGIPLKKGRGFTDLDRTDGPRVAIIDDVLAAAYWPGRDPIGTRVDPGDGKAYEVVGIAGGVQHSGLAAARKGTLYFTYQQQAFPGMPMALVARTSGDPQPLLVSMAAAVRSVDSELPVYDSRTMQQRVEESVGSRRFATFLLGAFATVALVLAVIGIYGVMAYNVAQRTGEIGVRVALGATQKQVIRMVLSESLRIIAVGLGAGAALSLMAGRALSSMLFKTSPFDPAVLAATGALLAAAALAASYLPAMRACRIDPITALRYE